MTTELTDQALRDLLEDLGPEQPEEGGPWMTTVKTQRALCEGLFKIRQEIERFRGALQRIVEDHGGEWHDGYAYWPVTRDDHD